MSKTMELVVRDDPVAGITADQLRRLSEIPFVVTTTREGVYKLKIAPTNAFLRHSNLIDSNAGELMSGAGIFRSPHQKAVWCCPPSFQREFGLGDLSSDPQTIDSQLRFRVEVTIREWLQSSESVSTK